MSYGTSRSSRVKLTVTLLCSILFSVVAIRSPRVQADGLRDNNAEDVRRIPRAGIEVDAQTRQELEHELTQLSAMIESLYSKQFVDSMARANMHEGLAALHAGEVAALALNALGALDSSALPSATTVKDFSELPPLQPGWTLGAKVKVALG